MLITINLNAASILVLILFRVSSSMENVFMSAAHVCLSVRALPSRSIWREGRDKDACGGYGKMTGGLYIDWASGSVTA